MRARRPAHGVPLRHHRGMTTTTLPPPFTAPERLAGDLRSRGHAVLSPAGLGTLAGVTPDALDALRPSWNELPPDAYLRDGGRYRRRRHSCFVVEGTLVERVPHRAHWQPVEYNALHGGLERGFEPMRPDLVAQRAWQRLLLGLGAQCSAANGEQRWYVE